MNRKYDIAQREKMKDNRKKKLRMCGCLLLCFSIIFTLIPIPVSAKENKQKVVRVGWYEDSYHISGKNGKRSGY